jgi:8-oxo-dGTP pyrophosphatase MutT (NUDIX family)
MSKIITTTKEVVLLDNEFVRVHNDEVQFPSGKLGRYFRYQWKCPYGVAILPIKKEKVCLIRSYSYQFQQEILEIPHGFGTFGGEPIGDARRETFEELGIKDCKLEHYKHFKLEQDIYVFAALLDDEVSLSIDHQESTEAISGFEWIEWNKISLSVLNEIGVRDTISLAVLLDFALSKLNQPI